MTSTPPTDAIGLDGLFDALGHPLRRRLLTRLRDIDARAEDGFDQRAVVNGGDPESWDVELVHTHLPKLHVADFVDWDRENGVVRRGPRFDESEPLIALMVTHEEELTTGWP